MCVRARAQRAARAARRKRSKLNLVRATASRLRTQAISVALHGARGPATRALSQSGAVLLLALTASRLVDGALSRFDAHALKQAGAKERELAQRISPDRDVSSADVAAASERLPLLHAYLTRPFSVLIWSTAAAAIAGLFIRAGGGSPIIVIAGQPLEAVLYTCWQFALILCLSWAVILYSGAALERAARQDSRRAPTFRMLHAMLSRLVVALASLAALGLLRVPLSALLTFGGVGGVLIGVGAREVASNATAGVGLLMSHAIREGDFIELIGKDIAGVVVELSLTTTTLLCADATRVTLPNALLGAGAVRNLSRRGAATVSAEYSISAEHAAKLPTLCGRLERFLAAHPAVVRHAEEGALRSGVALTASSKFKNTMSVLVQAYIGTQGRSAADIERAKREVLTGSARIVLDAELALVEPTVTAVVPLEAEAMPTSTAFRARAALPSLQHAKSMADELKGGAVVHEGKARGSPGAMLPGDVDDPEGFSWRSGELEKDD